MAFPLLTDPGARTAAAYGVKMQDQELAIPAVFVVHRDGAIVWRYVGESMTDRPASERVLEVLRDLSE